MKSMTGFGSATATQNNIEISVEVSCVNKKNLEVHASMPREWQNLERTINELARKHFQRGKINVSLKISNLSETGGLSWDEAAINSTIDKIREIAKKQNISEEITPDLILNIAKVASSTTQLPSSDTVLPTIQSTLDEAMQKASEMRLEEGQALAKDLVDRLQLLSENAENIKENSKGAVPKQRQALFERLEQAKLGIDLNDERILKELALFADKCDITEELTLLSSHIDQLNAATQVKDEAIGRKMDFICQEINRELNTIGSKSNLLEVTKLVIDSKNELERIREQVQNVE